MTSAQGQEMTRKEIARYIQLLQTEKLPASMTSGGIIASRAAEITTTGVYMRANFVTKCSLRDLRSPAFSTSDRILETVDSPNGFVTCTRISPVRLTQPLMTASPTVASRGTDSPVSATVSSEVVPSRTVPSSGIFSPGRT